MTRSRPTDPTLDADLARAVGLHRSGVLGEAEAIYRRILASSPKHAYALNYLGTLLAATNRAAEGLDLLKRSVKEAPQVPELSLNLADTLAAGGRLDLAESALKRALQGRRSPEAMAKLGVVLLRQGKTQPAAHQLEQALKLAPHLVDVRCNLAVIRIQQDDTTAARRLLSGAIALAPAQLDAINSLAALDQTQGRLAPAISWLRRALAIAPAFSPAHANLGMTLEMTGERAAAARHDRMALVLAPGDPNAWGNYGNLIQAQGRPTEAEVKLRRGVHLQPLSATAWSNLGRTLNAQARFADAVSAYRRALDLDPLHAPARSNLLFLTQYDPSLSPADIMAEHVEFGRVHEAAASAARMPHRNRPEPERRLRVGYVSPDFGRHPVGLFLSPVLPRHDPAAVEVVCYSDRIGEDHVTNLIRESANCFRRVVGMPDTTLAELIREDRIDILVDLAGHTAGNRLPLFARKPAPVQVSWLGYYDTTGLSTIDAVLADPWEVEDGDERWYVEEVVRLPSGRLCYPIPKDAPKVPPLPALTGRPFTFACFNNATKLNDAVIDAWSTLLHRMPASRLMLRAAAFADPVLRDTVADRFRGRRVDPGRIDTGSLSADQVLTGYLDADLALDPFPFTGALTTCEALWMGLPVVTLKGKRTVSRQSASFLSRLGLTDLIADDVGIYVDQALALSHDLPRLEALRSSMRERMLGSSVTDGGAAARNLEAAYRKLWRRWCAAPGRVRP